MLRLENISVTHFKNYDQEKFDFDRNIIGIAGINGIGKTNLLDAIYYCCFTKSYFSSTDAMNVGIDKKGFRLEANFTNATEKYKVTCIHRGTGKKEFFLNDIPYDKLSSHIGLLPAVMIAPDDVGIITGLSELRRKYLDTILCQVDPEYLLQLMLYNRILQQRNSLLKSQAENRNIDMELLEVLNMQIAIPGEYIYNVRNEKMPEIISLANNFYREISGKTDAINIAYSTQLADTTLPVILKKYLQKDLLLQRTTVGIHRDDIELNMNGQVFRNIASQGQRKSMLFSLKLAEFAMIKKHKKLSPVLLLDDIFEKLDNHRIHNLLGWVCKNSDAQVFITDTDEVRLDKTLTIFNMSPLVIKLT